MNIINVAPAALGAAWTISSRSRSSSSSSSSSRRKLRWEAAAETPSSTSRNNYDYNSKRANLHAKRRERVRLPGYADVANGRSLSVGDFLSHPSGVHALLNSRALHALQPLASNTYRCTLHPIQFLKFEVAPTLDLKVMPTSKDCTVEMLSCKFIGTKALEQQNEVFSAFMRNHITWGNGSEPYLEVDVDLKISLEVYTKPFSLLPISVVEKPGNAVMQGLIDRLVPLLAEQLLNDYGLWVEEQLRLLSTDT